jgi:hypothetical protein
LLISPRSRLSIIETKIYSTVQTILIESFEPILEPSVFSLQARDGLLLEPSGIRVALVKGGRYPLDYFAVNYKATQDPRELLL